MDHQRNRRLELVKKDEPAITSGVLTSNADALESTITTGTMLEGKYLVGRVLGTGAVGIVFEAKNVELDETVAIKVLRPEMMKEEAVVGRFAREAKAAAGLKSEYVSTVYDVGTTKGGTPFIVMEYLDGKDLGTVLAEGGSLGPRTVVEYALQVCEALAVAHSRGIVHRDIKPENLLLTERAGGMKIVKVLDFGISKAALTGSIFKSAVPLVKTVSLMGTPLYMSPEQVRVTDSVDVRSDIWSLGMVIYEMLTGQTAFDGQSITELCAQILEAKPRPLEMFRNDLPSGLVEVVQKCLEKDVDKRYQNVAELALALMPFGPKRTRLNVERAIAVLQSSGHVASDLQVNSTMPPSPSDFMWTPLPSSGRLPSDLASGHLTAHSSSAVQVVPERRKSSFGIILGALAVAAVVVGAVAGVMTRSHAVVPVPETIQAKAASTDSTPVASPAPLPTMKQEPPRPDPVLAPGSATQLPIAIPRAVRATPPSTLPRPATSPVNGSKKPSAATTTNPAKTAEEPDMGY